MTNDGTSYTTVPMADTIELLQHHQIDDPLRVALFSRPLSNTSEVLALLFSWKSVCATGCSSLLIANTASYTA